ncbi:MAG: calcium-translocating P-type ATPase, PMCA-type, partial [Clostridiales bacterium]|nr:calcium-translocating P-type ATPase, PMCA-type [Clostridiales bacterium]
MKFYDADSRTVLDAVASRDDGLSGREAEERLERNGKNALAAPKGKSMLQRFAEQLKDPMILILICAAVVSGVLAVTQGESFADVIIIMAVVLINAVLGVYQENKAEKAIEALQQMSAATSRVMRDGKVVTLKSEDLVCGDIVLLEAGDAVPADGRILDCASLRTEEAALTGESVPVMKIAEPVTAPADGNDIPLGDRKNMLYMGSTVVYGRGTMVITATGMDTEMGKIAGALAQAEEGETPLQRKMAQLSRVLTWLVLGICAVVFGIHLFKYRKFDIKTIVDSFMVSVSLAVAAIPEGLAAVVTVVLSIGVTKMSKRSAIIRKLTAVETLGCAQIICSDKTGTLTQNKMTVTTHYGEDETELAKAMALCCDAELNEDGTVSGEPTEAALVIWADKLGLKKYELKEAYPRVCEAPFDSLRKMMSTVHRNGDGFVQYTKGAPDVLLGQCTSMMVNGQTVPMTEDARQKIIEQNKCMADKALRVLACAKRVWNGKPEKDEAAYLEQDLCFVGLCGMIDPVRPEVKPAIDRCRAAGIRPIMITGDHVDTAVAIAKELGILQDGQRAVTGAELGRMSDEEFENCYRDISVYARVQPEHKTRIVNMWKKDGSVTAMTGDGVNDAPSIKAADIGVGMGITGTDVTKNVADMVLADDNFATIVNAVEEGRRIYDNIRKAIQFLLSSNMSEVLAVFISSILGFTLLKPVHLLWINLVTDCFPALALGMEKGEKNVMHRKPRDAKAGIFAGGMGFDIAYQGVFVTALVLLSYFIGRHSGTNPGEYGMTMAFITMSLAEVFHSINMRSQRDSIFSLHSGNVLLYVSAIVSK